MLVHLMKRPPVWGDINGPKLLRPLWCPAFDGVLYFEQVHIQTEADNWRRSRTTFEVIAQVLDTEAFFRLSVDLQHEGLRAYLGDQPVQLVTSYIMVPSEWGNTYTLAGYCCHVERDLHPVLKRRYGRG